MVHKEVTHHVNFMVHEEVIHMLTLYMVHKEVIHPDNSLHGSQGSNISC